MSTSNIVRATEVVAEIASGNQYDVLTKDYSTGCTQAVMLLDKFHTKPDIVVMYLKEYEGFTMLSTVVTGYPLFNTKEDLGELIGTYDYSSVCLKLPKVRYDELSAINYLSENPALLAKKINNVLNNQQQLLEKATEENSRLRQGIEFLYNNASKRIKSMATWFVS